jgi:hypothetical protein
MPYSVFGPDGHFVAFIADTDPDLQRALHNTQYRVPALVVAAPAPAPKAPVAWAQPAAAAKPARPHANTRQEDVSYRVRHVPTGRFLGEGLDPNKSTAPKIWPNHGNVKNAVSHAVRRGLGDRSDFEIVPTTMS